MRKLLLSALCGLAAGLWLLTAAACKSKTADDIRALAHKELQQTALRYAKNAKDLRITAIEEVFCSNEACILGVHSGLHRKEHRRERKTR